MSTSPPSGGTRRASIRRWTSSESACVGAHMLRALAGDADLYPAVLDRFRLERRIVRTR